MEDEVCCVVGGSLSLLLPGEDLFFVSDVSPFILGVTEVSIMLNQSLLVLSSLLGLV